jgi:hypothetical protein
VNQVKIREIVGFVEDAGYEAHLEHSLAPMGDMESRFAGCGWRRHPSITRPRISWARGVGAALFLHLTTLGSAYIRYCTLPCSIYFTARRIESPACVLWVTPISTSLNCSLSRMARSATVTVLNFVRRSVSLILLGHTLSRAIVFYRCPLQKPINASY